MNNKDGMSNYVNNGSNPKNFNINLDYLTDKHRLTYLETIYSGLNSKVYLLSDNSKKYTLKIFNLLNKNSNNRIKREVDGLRLLNFNQIKNVPNLIYFDFNKSYVLTDYINGKKIRNFSYKYIDQIINFNLCLHRNKLKDKGLKILDASDNYIQMQNFLRIMDDKFIEIKNQIMSIEGYKGSKASFIEFLYNEFLQKFTNYKNKTNYIYDLSLEDQIFSQSDVGIHNCLDCDGKLYFLDFEHSGWDDPAKFLADWVLRPNGNINDHDSLKLIIKFCEKWHDKNLIYRIKDILPIINIKWILIRLNIGFSKKFKNSEEFLNISTNKKIYENGVNQIENLDRFLDSYK